MNITTKSIINGLFVELAYQWQLERNLNRVYSYECSIDDGKLLRILLFILIMIFEILSNYCHNLVLGLGFIFMQTLKSESLMIFNLDLSKNLIYIL